MQSVDWTTVTSRINIVHDMILIATVIKSLIKTMKTAAIEEAVEGDKKRRQQRR